VLRDRRRHPLDHVVDIGETRVNDRPTERLEPRHVERDVVVDDEDGTGTATARVLNVGDHVPERKPVKVSPTHLDDRAEAAVERAPARCLDDVHAPAEHRVAGQHPGRAVRRSDRSLLDRRDGPTRRAAEAALLAKP